MQTRKLTDGVSAGLSEFVRKYDDVYYVRKNYALMESEASWKMDSTKSNKCTSRSATVTRPFRINIGPG